MLSIEKGDRVPLPKRHHLSHNMCVIVHDLIVEIIKSPGLSKFFDTSIPISDDERELVDRLDKDNKILDWVQSKGRKDLVNQILGKNLPYFITSDLCNFVYESLSCAKKGKMSVAYSLLRKPITDELLLLEQLLIDSDDFLERFYHIGSTADYDPSHKTVGAKRVNEIIAGSLNLFPPYFPFSLDVLYQIRYDKLINTGFNSLTNQALHIVTTDKRYGTEKQNLNFIFSMPKDYRRYWEHYYYFVPYVLAYVSGVVDRIAFRMLGMNEATLMMRDFRRHVGLSFCLESTHKKIYSKTYYKILGQAMATKCKKCKTNNEFVKEDFKLFAEVGEFVCSKCFRLLNVQLK